MKKVATVIFVCFFVMLSGRAVYAENKDIKKDQYIIVYKDEESKERQVSISSNDVYGELENVPVIGMNLTEQAAVQMNENPDVVSIEKNVEVKITDSIKNLDNAQEAKLNETKEAWGLEHTGINVLRKEGITGKGVKVAIIDSGVEQGHEDLTIAGGVSFIEEKLPSGITDTSIEDYHGHGTHVAGIVGAKDNDKGVVGVAPDSEIYVLKVFDSTGTGSTFEVIQAVDWSITHNMDIVNLSIGSQSGYEVYHQVFQEAYDAGVIIVAAAGNDFESAPWLDTVDYPAVYDEVISVAAVDENNERGYFSSVGPSVEIAAPGVDIISTYLNNGYATMSGTSMASPYVSGLAALMESAYPSYTNKEIRQKMIDEAVDVGSAGRDISTGFGVISAFELNIPVSKEPFEEKITLFEATPLYKQAKESSKTATVLQPQTVIGINKMSNGYYEINTWLGPRYIKPNNYIIGETNKVAFDIKLGSRVSLYQHPFDDKRVSATLSPQIIYSTEEYGGFYKVSTWMGMMWVKPLDAQYIPYEHKLTMNYYTKLYDKPHEHYYIGASISPQDVIAVERIGGWYKIKTWLGEKYIKPHHYMIDVKDSSYLHTLKERSKLYKLPSNDMYTGGQLAPQTVQVKKEYTDGYGIKWLNIKTWNGDRWVKR